MFRDIVCSCSLFSCDFAANVQPLKEKKKSISRMSAANAGSHHSSSSAGSASRRSSAWFSSYNSGYSGYSGLTELRSASAHGYGSGVREGSPGVLGQACRSPAVSSILHDQMAPVPASSTHISGGHAAPYSPWNVSQGHPAPRLSPPLTHVGMCLG